MIPEFFRPSIFLSEFEKTDEIYRDKNLSVFEMMLIFLSFPVNSTVFEKSIKHFATFSIFGYENKRGVDLRLKNI